MAGRLVYLLIGGAAVVGGMFVQGDLGDNGDEVDREVARVATIAQNIGVNWSVDSKIDAVGVSDGDEVAIDATRKRALSEAVAELVRAEGSLITARLDDEMPTAVRQAEQRRDAARQAVDRLAEDVRAETRGNRDALRQNIRDDVREGVRSAIRS